MTNSLNVLMQNRDPKLWPGGDVIALNGFSETMKKLGVLVLKDYSYASSITKCDIVLSWNINYPWVLSHLIHAKTIGKHFVVFCLNTSVNDREYQRAIIKYSDGLIFLSTKEKEAVSHYLGVEIPHKKSYFIEIGVDSYYESKNEELKRGVLCVGRIEKRKNQLSLIKACVSLNYPLTIVGKVADEEYYKECLSSLTQNDKITFIPYCTKKELKDLYVKSKVIANVANLEPWGLTIREGGLSNCNALMTTNTYVKNKLPDVWWCDPSKYTDIQKKLQQAYETPNSHLFHKLVRDKYNWEHQTQQLVRALRGITKKKPILLKTKDWAILSNLLNKQIDTTQNKLNESARLVHELDNANKLKQTAIEVLQKSEQEKQAAIESLRETLGQRHDFLHLLRKIFTLQ